MPSLDRRLQLIAEELDGPGRFQDICLALRRQRTRETLLYVGGQWDRLERRYTEATPENVAVIDLEESQVEFTIWFEKFLADYREGLPRDVSAALIAGDRRAGKTFDVYFCQIAALIEVPVLPSTRMPSVGWTVSKTFRERDELDQLISSYIPRDWYHAQRAPEHRYDFTLGCALRNLSADDPDSLKQGRVDWLFYNEAQKIPARAIVHGIYGTADQAGMTLLTANRPSAADSRGEWLFDVKEAIDDELRAQAKNQKREPLGIVYFGLSSKQNTKIDQPARRRVAKLAALIDPTTAEADDSVEGEWKRPGDRAVWEFDKHRDLHAAPAIGSPDVTREVARREEYGAWDVVAGVDLQSKPHIVALVVKCFGDPDAPTYYFVDEHVESRSTEEQFIEAFSDRFPAYTVDSALLVLDASGFWQDAKHGHLDGRTSASVFEGAGYSVIPPQVPRGKTGRARNPYVDERLSLFNELLRKGRIKIDPVRCPWLVECVREATTKRDEGRRKLVSNKFAHAIDAATYPIWRLEPRPNSGPRLTRNDVRVVTLNRRGDR